MLNTVKVAHRSTYVIDRMKGKSFAQRQSKWDALFMGIGAMGRDENLLSYILRLLLSVAFNFTIGKVYMLPAAFAFQWHIFYIIAVYQMCIKLYERLSDVMWC